MHTKCFFVGLHYNQARCGLVPATSQPLPHAALLVGLVRVKLHVQRERCVDRSRPQLNILQRDWRGWEVERGQGRVCVRWWEGGGVGPQCPSHGTCLSEALSHVKNMRVGDLPLDQATVAGRKMLSGGKMSEYYVCTVVGGPKVDPFSNHRICLLIIKC